MHEAISSQHKTPKPDGKLASLRVFLGAFDWSPGAVAAGLFCSLFAIFLCYRALLYAELYLKNSRLLQFDPAQHPLIASLSHIWDDLMLITLVCALVWLVGWGTSALARALGRRVPLALHVLGIVLVHGMMSVAVLICGAHFSLMENMHTGLTYEVVIESMEGQGMSGVFTMANTAQLVGMVVPFALLWLMLWTKPQLQFWRNRVVVAMVVFFGLLQLLQAGDVHKIATELRRNPVMFAASDIVRGMRTRARSKISQKQFGTGGKLGVPKGFKLPKRQPPAPSPRKGSPGTKAPQARKQPKIWTKVSTQQLRSLQLISPAFVDHPPAKKAPAKAPTKDWNIVLIILESTGFQYIFNTSLGNPVPMPFVKKIAAKSWMMTRHFSPSNSTPRSVFSIMSGLFPLPQLHFFSMWPKNSVPSLATILGPKYDAFLTNPSPLRWYFPRHFLRNSGLTDLYGYYKLPLKKHGPGKAWARDEREVTSFFIKRLERAKEPFFATMCSFIPHWPYTDYGPEYRILPVSPNRRSWLQRYYNNLRLLDIQIQRVFESLKQQKRLERTIVVMVGDHGEAFGQHRGNWTHSRHSFNENYQTPFIIYQPKLFKPKVISRYTSHVDVIPTLLDAMGKPYNPRLLQGESLWGGRPFRRKYIYLFGNENTLSSISRKGIKVQISFKFQRCWAYDLAADPLEKRRLGCGAYQEQMWATLLYRKYQTQTLRRYNSSRLAKKDFFGARHPAP